MRCFIAIDIQNEEIINKLARICLEFNLAGVKPVEKENLHVTLKFLGELNERDVEEIKKALNNVKFKKFHIHISELGAFPSIKNPRVIWAGIKEGFAELKQLHKLIEFQLKSAGFKFIEEDYHPHVTLARIKDRRSIKEVIKKIIDSINEDFGTFLSEYFSLKLSVLTPKGPIYKDLKIFRL